MPNETPVSLLAALAFFCQILFAQQQVALNPMKDCLSNCRKPLMTAGVFLVDI